MKMEKELEFEIGKDEFRFLMDDDGIHMNHSFYDPSFGHDYCFITLPNEAIERLIEFYDSSKQTNIMEDK